MDFGWTEEQEQRRREAVEFAETHLNDALIARNRDGEWSWEAWRACAEFGLLGLAVPEAYGGTDTDIMTTILVMEGIGYGCRENGLPFALNSLMWSVQPALVTFGTPEQNSTYLPRLVTGECVGAFAISEPETGSDSYAMATTAERVDGGYVLNGQKAYITFAPIAEFAIVFASTAPELGSWGISAFIVDRSTEGYTAEPVEEKMGLRTTPFGKLTFDGCFVPEENRLGPEGGGVAMFTRAMESERSYVLASQLGRMERQLDACVEYARERQAFGQSIGKFQAVSHRIADMTVRLETARHLLYKVAWLEQQGKPLLKEAAMAKLHISECFVESSLDAIRIHGAKGYATEFEVERDLRDGVGGLLYSGTSDIQRNIVSHITGL
ncbi:MAG: acyl-CoA dehydrogenase family protein [Ilumatobacter sp.]|uniref:acyl-CoA dehydrogenase family protein n=1 Tax=Ilumatobacter sp. TaxID=1967498 RepID=UPI00262BBC43|nr:acyl-CoA dehydrogenase family protein [Ilumatobacter sp.]MDJ0767177.1 acyl-CoA dehydrogenase family protein [Ilumatobacter sp.]